MKKIYSRVSIFIVFFLVMSSVQQAQVKNSFYSMFGIGQITDRSYGVNKTLGGTGIAFQSGRSINYLNPASYLGINANSYILEVGVNGLFIKSKQERKTQTTNDFDFSYASANLYINNWWATSFGLVPYSSVDYKINSTDQIGGELTTFEKTYEGSGGLNRLYWGNSFRLINNLSLGINTCYIFGHILQTETALSSTNFSGYELTNNRFAQTIYFDYGLQYSLPISSWQFTVGGIYGSAKTINTSDDLQITYSGATLSLTDETKPDIKIPEKYGIGIALKKGENFRAGFDYEFKKWSEVKFSNSSINTMDSHWLSAGIEYSPGDEDNKQLSSVFYRLGANFKQSYLELNRMKISSFGINIGLGIPFDGTSMINIGLEYGKEGTLDKGLIQNEYLQLHLNISLQEFWGLKSIQY